MKESRFDPRCHIGETHGIYTIIEILNEKDKYGHYIYVAECKECGYKKYSHYGGIASASKKTNTCKHLELSSTKCNNHRINKIFDDMKRRCYRKQNKDYRWYGEKGIKVCDEWLNNPKSFEQWALQNGYKDDLTIDRIEEDKDYSPDNCRWVPLEENARRAGKVNWITIDNETLTGRQWAEKMGLGVLTIDKYIKKYGLEKTRELIVAMTKQSPSTKYRKSKQTWFSVYDIQL